MRLIEQGFLSMASVPPNRQAAAVRSSSELGSSVSLGVLGLGICAISFLVAILLIRSPLRETQGVLQEDLEKQVRRYNNPQTTRIPRVGGSQPVDRPLFDAER